MTLKVKITFLFFLSVCLWLPVNGQGTMFKQSGHYIAVLDFFNNHPLKNSKGRITHATPETNGLTNTAAKWYEANGVRVKGLLKSAALQVDWWILLGEPTEQYEFQWASSGSYDIVYRDKDGKTVVETISEAKLQKYPDLLKRFKALKPTDADFEINWRIGDQTSSDRLAFQQKYNLFGSIGSEMPHVKKSFTTIVKSSGLLFEPSGIKPFAVPGIRQGKGQEFLGLTKDYDARKLAHIFDYFNISTGHNISGFKATRMTWNVEEMKVIAERFASYEKGEESAKDKIAKADEENKNTKAYNKDDFWGDAAEKPVKKSENCMSPEEAKKWAYTKMNDIVETLKPLEGIYDVRLNGTVLTHHRREYVYPGRYTTKPDHFYSKLDFSEFGSSLIVKNGSIDGISDKTISGDYYVNTRSDGRTKAWTEGGFTTSGIGYHTDRFVRDAQTLRNLYQIGSILRGEYKCQ